MCEIAKGFIKDLGIKEGLERSAGRIIGASLTAIDSYNKAEPKLQQKLSELAGMNPVPRMQEAFIEVARGVLDHVTIGMPSLGKEFVIE